ncbi:YdcF family protein [Hymenobacter sp. RP-2-7]|uniref:YdcF family protein n=1 Tax=Hymenobacter polaris TaxID=2682546 RepID=A0A7Y0ABK6_9BACT|nr:YdcF family protein [Hymenobacter polaris]NML64345.1 YdcF family protein [Hymenobacter polaris]
MTPRFLPALLSLLLLSRLGAGQPAVPHPAPARADSLITAKAFPLLAWFEARPALQQALRAAPGLQQVARRQAQRSARALAQPVASHYADSLTWQPAEVRAVGQQLQALYSGQPAFRAAMLPVLARYPLYAGQPDTAVLRHAWQDAALGLNRIMRVYLANAAPRYPAIDSSSFPRHDAALARQVSQQVAPLVSASRRKPTLFYALPLQAALLALRLNGRDEAARYEPLRGGLNAAPSAAAARTAWARYPYQAILVPGSGPEQPGMALDSAGAYRCRLAAASYRAGQAPFVVVSGGHVHPNKTPYCEAVEMKKYLVGTLGLPAAAVFIEPHARHTTTNLRNTARLLAAVGAPPTQPLLVVTDAAQSRYILGMEARCRRELGYVPYRSLQRLSETANSCLPMPEAAQPDPFDPLDP